MIEPAQAAATGIGSRQNWKVEVTDLRALVIAAGKASEAGNDMLLGYLVADMTALRGVARSLKSNAVIPGVRIYAEDSLSVRSNAA